MEDGGDAGDAGAGESAVGRQIFLHFSAAVKGGDEVDAVRGLERIGPVGLPDEFEPAPALVVGVARPIA